MLWNKLISESLVASILTYGFINYLVLLPYVYYSPTQKEGFLLYVHEAPTPKVGFYVFTK